jgi:hypothetical protein
LEAILAGVTRLEEAWGSPDRTRNLLTRRASPHDGLRDLRGTINQACLEPEGVVVPREGVVGDRFFVGFRRRGREAARSGEFRP